MVIDFRVRGYKCAYHTNEQAVTFCDYCRKPICRKCAEKGKGQGNHIYCNAECREAAAVRRRDESLRREQTRLKKSLKHLLKYGTILIFLAAVIYFILHWLAY